MIDMRITIIGSVKFVKDMAELHRQLKELGHEPQMLEHMFGLADGSNKQLMREISDDHAATKRRHDYFKRWNDLIKSGDAVLVCNLEKNGIKNYIGGNTLMEMGFAHVNDKKVFLLNPIPEDVPYTDEIKALVDTVLDGDLERIE